MNRSGWTALAAAICTLGLAACSGGADGTVQGYVEGTYVYVSPDDAGRIVERPATAGETVVAGDVLARLDESDEHEAVAGAEARLAQAEAQLANLRSGKRPVEISVIEAQLSEARANFDLAEQEYQRQLVLREKNVVSQSAVDTAKARRDAAEASVRAIEHELDVAKLPARPEEIEAAERNVAAEQAAVAQARIALERRTLTAPGPALIEETFFEPGEFATAGAAIVSLLPDANRKIRFFVPEPRLAGVAIGSKVGVACDDCPDGLEGEVDFVSSAAEFTPPVIYSRDVRDKLVFRVEAKPLGEAVKLKVGQPVDVTLPTGAGS
ncbi:MAG: HlyD family efflux transporter periplasmic adaptor subunit [Bauldia sp.]|nr:HlyD family efflux transporter periplasmic adaptor subunit [Bauldia sp.]